MASTVYNVGKDIAASIRLADSSEAILNMLVTTGYTYNNDHTLLDDGTTSDPKSYEIGVSYTRQTLATKVKFTDNTNDFVGIDAGNITHTAVTAGATIGAVVSYRYTSSGGTTSDTGQVPISYYAVTATPTNGGDIVIAWAATSDGGWLKYGSTS